MHPVPIHLEITNAARAKGLHMVMVFCILKPFDDPSLSDIQHYFNQYESEGMTKEVCLLFIKKICGNPLAPPPAAVHPPAAAAAAATTAGAIDLEFYLSKTF